MLIENPTLLFVLLLALSLGVPLLCERLRIPGIVGLIVAGMVLGPNAAGVAERGEFITLLGQAGLMFIVFVAGLEIDLGRFRRFWRHSAIFGTVSYLIPQVGGALIFFYLMGFSWPSAILLGSMLGSHTLLAYPVAAKLGIVRSLPVTTSVGGTIITDTSALLVLAFIAKSTTGHNDVGVWVSFAIFLSLYLILVLGILPIIARAFFRYVPDEGARDFLFTILAAFFCAWLAEFIGLQPIIGAFLSGLALNQLIPERSPLMNRIQFVGRTLLIPMFLISVGMLVDPRALIGDWETISIIITMSLSVVSLKLIAAFAAGKALRYTTDDCWVLFGMTVNQAAATLAAVIVGYDIGLFSTAVVNGAIVMILVSTLIGPYATEYWGRKVADNQDFTPEPEDTLDNQRILIPLANPETVNPLIDIALLLRDPASREPIFPLTIVTEDRNIHSSLASAEKLLARAVVRASAGACPVTPITRVDVNIAEGIRRALSEQQGNTLIIGWHSASTLANRIFGSVLDQLLKQTTQTLIVTNTNRQITGAKRILVALPRAAEKEPSFPQTVRHIKILARQLSASIHLLGPTAGTKRALHQFEQARPQTPVTYTTLPRFRDLPALIAAELNVHDLLILVSARSHRLSWTSSLDHLPQDIMQVHPQLPFITIYPADDTYDPSHEIHSEQAPIPTPAEAGEQYLLRKEAILLAKEPANVLPDLLNHILDKAENNKEVSKELNTILSTSAQDYPAEIREGVFLLHGHGKSMRKPRLFIIAAKGGETILRNGDDQGYLFLGLVTPESYTAEMHLRLLRRIALYFRKDDIISLLAKATDAETIWNGLKVINEE